jgi:hypothetical protein
MAWRWYLIPKLVAKNRGPWILEFEIRVLKVTINTKQINLEYISHLLIISQFSYSHNKLHKFYFQQFEVILLKP